MKGDYGAIADNSNANYATSSQGPFLCVFDNRTAIPGVILSSAALLLSIAGSSCIIYMSSFEWRTLVQQRLLLGLSMVDCLASLSFLLIPHLLP